MGAGEGSRGGKVVGHTKTGRPIYAGEATAKAAAGLDPHPGLRDHGPSGAARGAVDNQGRSLAGVKAHFDAEAARHAAGAAASSKAFAAATATHPLAAWTSFEGVKVLRAGQDKHVAVPANGKENAAHFDVIDTQTRQLVTQVKKAEVHNWLWRASRRDS